MAETAPATSPQAQFKIESLDDLRKVMTIAKGGDPNAIQAITKFMDFDSPAERSYFPDKTITLATAQLSGFGKVYFPNDDWNPFTLVADVIAVHFMGYKGYKSSQFVDMTRQNINLADLQTSMSLEEKRPGLLNRLFGRSNTE